MSLLLRSLMRDARPVTRLVRRLENDLFDDWPAPRKVRRTLPVYEPVSVMEDMSRQMARAINQVQELVEEMDRMDDWVSRFDDSRHRRREPEALVQRTESGNLQLALDMSDFKPEDLKIKLVDDNNLLVEAESESSGKDSYNKSHYKRWFRLPEDVKVDEIKSKLTDGNKLVIDLPLNKPLESSERTIPIQMEKKQSIASDNSENMQIGQQKENQQEQHNENRRERMTARG
uniref:Heat shock protein Hsp-16.1/Hsp-16.11 n=1 Tax=Aceria tosichella TaxID=561515 RepID=A0A6G1S607_9ACAR